MIGDARSSNANRHAPTLLHCFECTRSCGWFGSICISPTQPHTPNRSLRLTGPTLHSQMWHSPASGGHCGGTVRLPTCVAGWPRGARASYKACASMCWSFLMGIGRSMRSATQLSSDSAGPNVVPAPTMSDVLWSQTRVVEVGGRSTERASWLAPMRMGCSPSVRQYARCARTIISCGSTNGTNTTSGTARFECRPRHAWDQVGRCMTWQQSIGFWGVGVVAVLPDDELDDRFKLPIALESIRLQLVLQSDQIGSLV
ncbi:MAG: hypothetical protein RSP_14770 [Rhodanobacter sp.]